MRVSIIQDIIYWADKPANLSKTGDQIAALAGQTDLVILPEMFTTGFCTDQLDLAESMNDTTVKTLREWAVKYQLAITGSFIAKENETIFNRAFFVFPSGEICTADKRHLFSTGGEHLHFSAGDKRMIVNYCGFNICILVCYDVRFPVWARNRDNEYDLLVYVSNFPEKRINDWDVLLKARAVENQSYVCGVNRVGVDGLKIKYNGHSALLDFRAASLLHFSEKETSIQTYELHHEPLHVYRQKFQVWRDADEFELK